MNKIENNNYDLNILPFGSVEFSKEVTIDGEDVDFYIYELCSAKFYIIKCKTSLWSTEFDGQTGKQPHIIEVSDGCIVTSDVIGQFASLMHFRGKDKQVAHLADVFTEISLHFGFLFEAKHDNNPARTCFSSKQPNYFDSSPNDRRRH